MRIHFLAEAQVGSVMQPQRANTELGEFRRTDDHAPGVFSCPTHADSVDRTEPLSLALALLRVALRCWSEQNENHGNLKQGSNFKNG